MTRLLRLAESARGRLVKWEEYFKELLQERSTLPPRDSNEWKETDTQRFLQGHALPQMESVKRSARKLPGRLGPFGRFWENGQAGFRWAPPDP